MTTEQIRLIASLKYEPAYLALLDHLDEEVSGMLGSLENAETPAEIMRYTRLWQVAVKLVATLRIAPEAMADSLKIQAERGPVELGILAEDEDPFLRPKRPFPPTSQENLQAEWAYKTGKILLEEE